MAAANPISLTQDWGWVNEDESIFCPGGEWWGNISLFFIIIVSNIVKGLTGGEVLKRVGGARVKVGGAGVTMSLQLSKNRYMYVCVSLMKPVYVSVSHKEFMYASSPDPTPYVRVWYRD